VAGDMIDKNQHPIDLSQRLFIELGTPLLIETGKIALSGKLIGMKVGAYIIVDICGVDAEAISLSQEENVQVRYVNQDDIFCFSSRILTIFDQPDNLMFLHYPDKVESCNIRKYKRIDCFLQVHVKSAGRKDAAVITNISANGCLCNMDLFPSWESINGQRIELLFSDEGREFLAVSGEVKSTKIQGSQIKLGVQFMEADGYFQSVLSTLVPALRF
jgi:c-di-GMP-binding flagellar brake protein YcgR